MCVDGGKLVLSPVTHKLKEKVRRGAVAQGLEQSAHNRLVAGSNPARPTNQEAYICVGFFEWLSACRWAATKLVGGENSRWLFARESTLANLFAKPERYPA